MQSSNESPHQSSFNEAEITSSSLSPLSPPPTSSSNNACAFENLRQFKKQFSLLCVTVILLATARFRNDHYHRNEGQNVFTKLSSTVRAPAMEILASQEQHVASVDDLVEISEPVLQGTDIPFFFHVPRSGGSTIKDILSECMKLPILSSERVFGMEEGDSHNVLGGQGQMQLLESSNTVVIADVLPHTSQLFGPDHDRRGRMFTMIRHPIQRVLSMFNYLGVAEEHEFFQPDLAYVTVEMYARSRSREEFNWMTRYLSDAPVLSVELTEWHLQRAKEVLKRKCLVGLLEEKGESFRRFKSYFGWKFNQEHGRDCQDRFLYWGFRKKNDYPHVQEGSEAWELLYQQNKLDMELYEYAKQLFLEQGKLFRDDDKKVGEHYIGDLDWP